MGELKTLANCKPSEFLSQTVKIRRSVEKWLTVTKVMDIRKRLPEQLPVKKGDENAKANLEENIRRQREQAVKNLWAMFDVCFEEHPQETLEVLALLCFVEPEHVDDYPMSRYIAAFGEMINDESVVSFFTSLLRWGQMNTSKT